MRKLLLNPTPLFRKLRQLSMLLTLLLALPQTAMGDEVTYTFGSEIGQNGGLTYVESGKYTISSKSGGNSQGWTITNFEVTQDRTGWQASSDSLKISNIYYLDSGDPAATTVDFLLTSDFTLTGAFVSAEITYCTNKMETKTVTIGKNGGTYISLLTDENEALGSTPTTISLNNSHANNRNFNGNKISFHFYFTTITATSGQPQDASFTIQSIKITTGPIEYDLKVENTQVTAGNASNILNDGKVSFDASSNILTLNDANLTMPIQTDIDNLIIELKGENKINTNAAENAIKRISSNETLNLTIRPASTDPLGSINLANSESSSTSLVDGFNLSLGGELFDYPSLNNSSTHNSYITSLLIGGQMVAKTGAVFSSHNKISFNNASNNNVLTLSGVSSELNSNKIISGLSNLTINYDGANTITMGDTATVITSTNSNSVLTFTKASDASSLTISNTNTRSIIHGFNSINYGDGIYTSTPAPATYINTPNNGLMSALDNTKPINSLSLSSNPSYLLWVAGTQATSTTSGTGWSYDAANNKLSLNNATINGSIISGLGDLTIDIQGTNTISVSDTASVIRSTSAGKLTITKTGTTASLQLNNTRQSYYHSPIIKDFASFELAEGLYLSNAKAYGDEEVPAGYEAFTNVSQNGGNSTMGLITPTLLSNGDKGIRNITISTNEYYPIWVAHHRASVGNGYNVVYTQISPTNKDDFLGDGVPRVSFIPASTGNGNVNTLVLNGAAITDAIISNLVNLTIEFSGTNSLCENGKTEGYIHSSNPNAIITFKSVADNSSISLECANDYAVVEGFANVAFDKAVAQYSGSFSYNTTEKRYKNNSGALQSLTIKAPTAPTMVYNDQEEKVTLGKTYPDGDIYYTITYADGKTANVAKTKYTAEFALDAPGTVEAWVEANGATTSTVKGKHFGYKDAPFVMAVNETKTPELIPAFEAGDNIGYATAATPYSSSDTGVATFANGIITAVSSGTATLTTKLAITSGANSSIVILNSNSQFNTTVKVATDISSCFQGQNNYGTYYNTADNYTIPAGMEAYIVTGVSGNQVVLKSLSILPKQTALLLFKGTATSFNSVTTNETADTSENILMHADATVTTTGKEYILYKDEFVKATGTIPSGKCYLYLTGVAPARGMYGIGNDGSTAIEGIDVEATEDETWYDLQGRRIQKPTKAGIYIVNGKKVIINNK